MINNISTIIFLIGIVILIIVHIKLLRTINIDVTIWIVISIIFLVIAWILREVSHKEKYGYDNAYISGKIIGGTVYSSYPEDTPGLGWIL